MTKIVYNDCHGGFSLSAAAIARYNELTGLKESIRGAGRDINRRDPFLVQVVEELGEEANGTFAELKIATVAAGVRYRIDEYGGLEKVRTIDNYKWETA